jgi:hypothetical protein
VEVEGESVSGALVRGREKMKVKDEENGNGENENEGGDEEDKLALRPISQLMGP